MEEIEATIKDLEDVLDYLLEKPNLMIKTVMLFKLYFDEFRKAGFTRTEAMTLLSQVKISGKSKE